MRPVVPDVGVCRLEMEQQEVQGVLVIDVYSPNCLNLSSKSTGQRLSQNY